MFNALQDIDRLSQIVRALLLLSQAESGQLVLQKIAVEFGRSGGGPGGAVPDPAEAAGVRLTADVSPECPALVDRVQIERMINNLLSNAIKFTPEGGQVRMALKPSPEHIEMVVEDTGCGIAANTCRTSSTASIACRDRAPAPAPSRAWDSV